MNLFASITARLRRQRTEASLRRLDDHLLRDIGLTRHDVNRLGANGLPPEYRNFGL